MKKTYKLFYISFRKKKSRRNDGLEVMKQQKQTIQITVVTNLKKCLSEATTSNLATDIMSHLKSILRLALWHSAPTHGELVPRLEGSAETFLTTAQ